MWIIKVALQRPYTFIVLALLILILAPVVIFRTPTDIFPNINIPVVSVAWTYTGLNPEELEGRLTTPYEKSLTTLVDNIEHLESTTYNGVVVVKLFLQANLVLRPPMPRSLLPRNFYCGNCRLACSLRKSLTSAHRVFLFCN
jgi:multidrug efflux pump subunit AcrB